MPETPRRTGSSDTPDDDLTPSARTPLSIDHIFLGTDGLRVLWGVLLYVALTAVIYFVTLLIAPAFVQPPHPADNPFGVLLISPAFVLYNDGLPFFAAAIATWIMGQIEGRPASVYGFGKRRRLPNFLAGLGWGVALLTVLVFSLRAMGLLVFDARLLFGWSALRHGTVWLGGFLLVGLFEECFFRGYLQFTLARGLSGIYRRSHAASREALGFWTSAVLLSFGFGLTHRSNAGESPIGLLSVGLIGLVFCLSLWRTGSLWWAIGFHAAWDWAQSFLYGVADSGSMVRGHLFATHPVGRPVFSGGLTGPEGSLLILPTVALIAAVILLTLHGPRDSYQSSDTPQAPLHLDLP